MLTPSIRYCFPRFFSFRTEFYFPVAKRTARALSVVFVLFAVDDALLTAFLFYERHAIRGV